MAMVPALQFPETDHRHGQRVLFRRSVHPARRLRYRHRRRHGTVRTSEINWGVIPGGLVSKVLSIAMNYRESMYYALTGEKFSAAEAARMGLVNKVVPAARLKDEVMTLARHLSELNPEALRATKQAVKAVREMSMDQAHEYLMAKTGQLAFRDKENGYATGIKQFIDDKSFRPGLQPYARQASAKSESAKPVTLNHLPLDELKVLDLGTMVTAPLAAMLLGQLGAQVTKVEHPTGGNHSARPQAAITVRTSSPTTRTRSAFRSISPTPSAAHASSSLWQQPIF